MEKLAFVEKYYGLAEEVGWKFGLNPTVILAQSVQETGWGGSFLATEKNNFFGITAFGKPNDYWDGTKHLSTSSNLYFRVYKTPKDSFMDFARLITSGYPSVASVSSDSTQYAKAISNSSYISEKNGDNRAVYAKNLISFADYIDSVKDQFATKNKVVKFVKTKMATNNYRPLKIAIIAVSITAMAAIIFWKRKELRKIIH